MVHWLLWTLRLLRMCTCDNMLNGVKRHVAEPYTFHLVQYKYTNHCCAYVFIKQADVYAY